MADGGAEALRAMETRAIRETQLETYTSNLGSVALALAALLWLTLPPLWSVVNGEWSAAILPSLLAIAGARLAWRFCSWGLQMCRQLMQYVMLQATDCSCSRCCWCSEWRKCRGGAAHPVQCQGERKSGEEGYIYIERGRSNVADRFYCIGSSTWFE